MRLAATVFTFLLAPACGSSGGQPAKAAPAKAAPEPDAAEPPPVAAEQPAAPPPVAPEGAVVIGELFVQTCGEPACASALQPAGETHCRGLKLGEGLAWRLPTIAEAKAWAGQGDLHDLEGFHWTASPFEEDPGQAWIFDPVGGQSTTIPRDRKPFTIRCVAETG